MFSKKDMDYQGTTCQHLVADYMIFCLRKENLDWPGQCPVDLKVDEPGKCEVAMRAVGAEFEERYKQVFEEMCHQLHITPGNARATYTTIVDELFSDGVKWGRVVALLSFAGCMGVECAQQPGLHYLVNDVCDWTTLYLDNRLSPWIKDNGGWEGFIEFSKCTQKNESPWPSLKAVCGYAIGALGVLTLGAILAQRS